ncbi:MAG: UPF0182 family protein [Pseudonocardia sp.]|nr:UPF0182 family protein [Pseudonocardia sp.]
MTAGLPVSSARIRRGVITVVVAVVLALILANVVVDFVVDWLWFGALGYRDVFGAVLGARLLLFAVVGAAMAGVVAVNLVLAWRHRPAIIEVAGASDAVPYRYGMTIRARPWLFGVGVPLVVGVVAGVVGQGDWRLVRLFLAGGDFGRADPVFGNDIGFYAFDLPFYRWVLGWAFAAVVVSFIGSAVVHYLTGGIRLGGPERRWGRTPAAHRQLGLLAGAFVLLTAVRYFLDRYEILYSDRSALFAGATYTDLHAELPAKVILACIAVICAAAFGFGGVRGDLRVPAIATVLLIVSTVVLGWVWPALLQQISVEPNADRREAESIARNIEATRTAFGITDARVEYVDYGGGGVANAAQLADEAATVSNIRLLDPAVVSPTFTQLQQRENFYGFPAELDVDRYPVNGQPESFVVAARELDTDSLAEQQRGWINQHLRFTHGDGFVAARAAGAEPGAGGTGGYPEFTVSDTTGDGIIPVAQPRIYFGELIDSYVIVGGAPGAPPREYELDGTPFTYDGRGGVPIDGWLQRLIFAIEYGERNILFNEAIGEGSRIIFRQDPLERVAAAAPWLTLDRDPYPAVVDGRIVWIVDGYTTMQRYPYAQQVALGGDEGEMVGYVRNSVKATVDAYDGTVTLYAVDPDDPVLQAWMSVFPGTVKPATAMGAELREHLRYPQDLFRVQRDLLARYHVDDPQVFFSTNAFWGVPIDPTIAAEALPTGPPPPAAVQAPPPKQPPHYQLAGPPAGDGPPQFQLTSPMVGLRRQFTAAYVSVSSEPESYGRMRVLVLPTDAQTLGPQQVQTRFRSSAEVSRELNLLQAGDTDVRFGNLLTLPTGAGTLLHVEPVYVERTERDVSFPQLNRVLVLYGEQVGYAPTLAEALAEAAGSGAGAAAAPPAGPSAPPSAGFSPEAPDAAADIVAAIEALRRAKAAGDFAAEGQALIALDEATRRFVAATDGASTN